MKVKLFNTDQSNENKKKYFWPMFHQHIANDQASILTFKIIISKLFPNFHLYFDNNDILRMNEIGNSYICIQDQVMIQGTIDFFAETPWTTHKKLTTNSYQVAPYDASFNDMKCFEFSSRKQYRYYHVTRYIFHASLQEYRIVESLLTL